MQLRQLLRVSLWRWILVACNVDAVGEGPGSAFASLRTRDRISAGKGASTTAALRSGSVRPSCSQMWFRGSTIGHSYVENVNVFFGFQ